MIDLATGELAPVYGQVSAECGNRGSVCPACSATYKRDARQLVRAGLAGGKGTGLHQLDGARYCATPSTPTLCCAGWLRIIPAPSSKPANADVPTSRAASSSLRRTRCPAC
jgi:hypothetical protein